MQGSIVKGNVKSLGIDSGPSIIMMDEPVEDPEKVSEFGDVKVSVENPPRHRPGSLRMMVAQNLNLATRYAG
jgi:hypothetical protein